MKKKRTAQEEWEQTHESWYEWPKPKRISIYIYPAQMKMVEEIARVWKMKKRDIFFEAVQQYIGIYYDWKNRRDEKPRSK